jgi:predicted NBD/HSP70 family sugar kinase
MNKHLSIAIINMSILFNVKKVILCGNMMEYKDLFCEELSDAIKKGLNGNLEEIAITDVKNAAYGAALIAIEKSAYVLEL